MNPPNNRKTISPSSAMLHDNYAEFSRVIQPYNKLLERLESRDFVEFSRPVFEEHLKILKTAEDAFAMLFNDFERTLTAQPEDTANWLKAKENRDYAATTLEELQTIRQRLVAVMEGGRLTRPPGCN